MKYVLLSVQDLKLHIPIGLLLLFPLPALLLDLLASLVESVLLGVVERSAHVEGIGCCLPHLGFCLLRFFENLVHLVHVLSLLSRFVVKLVLKFVMSEGSAHLGVSEVSFSIELIKPVLELLEL
jgi:hypothetical protein